MKVRFFYADKEREHILRDAVLQGVRVHGDDTACEVISSRNTIDDSYDVGVVFGVKSKILFDAHKNANKPVILLDKGYIRRHSAGGMWEYCRVSVNSHHPIRYLIGPAQSESRFRQLELKLEPWREQGGHIVIAGSSAKYHNFNNLPDPESYVRMVIDEIREHCNDREIWYRPKPSYRYAIPVSGSRFSGRQHPLEHVLKGAHVMVTHGSNACFEALLAGIPSIILGNGITRPISSVNLSDIN